MTGSTADVAILTATFNGSSTLPRLFDSLCVHAPPSIEWIVVDDGSTDDTPEVVRALQSHSPFPILHARQANRGRHVALNESARIASARFAMVMDSDDWLVKGGLTELLRRWVGMSSDARGRCAAVVGLCVDMRSDVIGTPFPSSTLRSDLLSIRARHGVKGDKKELFRTDVLREFPFPVFDGERRVPMSLVLNRIARSYEALFVNVAVAGKHYRSEGLSRNIDQVRMLSPKGSRQAYLELLEEERLLSPSTRVRATANYVRYSLHAGVGLRELLRASPGTWPLGPSLPIGVALFLRDKSGWRGPRGLP